MTEDSLLDYIVREQGGLETPLYLYEAARLERAADELQTLFPPGAKLFYSLKANPQAGIVSHFDHRNIGPETASIGEWRTCLQAGIDPARILVGGVSKSRSFLRELCKARPLALVIDSCSEWERLKAVIPAGSRPRILLRIAPGVALGGLDMAGSSQFGLDIEQAIDIARDCERQGADFAGLHFYFGSQRLKTEPVTRTVEIAGETVAAFRSRGLDVGVVDIGLGCGVPYLARDAALDHGALRQQLQALWNEPVWEGIELWSEAGRALVGEAGYYVSRVTDVKRLHDKRFVFLDGGLNSHNPGVGLGRLLRGNPRFLFVSQGAPGDADTVDIVGNLCTSADVLGQGVAAPLLEEGDLVVIQNSGAYVQTTALWGFNSQKPFREMLLQADGTVTPLLPQYQRWLQTSGAAVGAVGGQ